MKASQLKLFFALIVSESDSAHLQSPPEVSQTCQTRVWRA